MKKILVCCLLVVPIAAESQVERNVMNHEGTRCTATMERLESGKPFGSLSAQTTRVTFEDPTCMGGPLDSFEWDINAGMINNFIVSDYRGTRIAEDANFATRGSELNPAGTLQKEGFCVQSTNYEGLSIAVVYETGPAGVTGFEFAKGIGGC